MTPTSADRAVKRARVHEILDGAGAESLLLSSQTALAWYLDGARIHVSVAAPPIVSLRVSREADDLFVTNNEATRLRLEELPDGIRLTVRRWDEPAPSAGNGTIAESAVDDELRAARRTLLPAEAERYRALCRATAGIFTEVLSTATPRLSERELAARLAGRVVEWGGDALVVLVAGESRLGLRHPLPTDAVLGRRAMAVLCVRRWGLIANVTRWLAFDEPSAELADADARLRAVEAEVFAATVPGARLASAFDTVAGAYGRHGFDRDEWRNHHQGGAAGYAGRDPRASSTVTDVVAPGQAFAWNPSAPGVKIEDTVLVGERGIEVLSADPRWPTVSVAGRDRPVTLQL